jgi:hypothetical protein
VTELTDSNSDINTSATADIGLCIQYIGVLQGISLQYASCRMWEYSRREEEGWLFYVVYKQAYIHERQECTRKCMTRKDTVNVIEGTRKYSAQVSDRWMTRVTDVPSRSRGARLTLAHLSLFTSYLKNFFYLRNSSSG